MYATSANSTARTVLFVEDDPLVLTIYKNRLEREGFDVKSAENGSVAIEMLPQVRPDLVVLDLMLPMVPGLEVLKFIRADADLKATPVVVLSNVYMNELARKAMQAGANQGILKTECTPAKLVAIIRELLGSTIESESQPAGSSPDGSHAADAAGAQAEEASLEQMRAELLRDGPAETARIREHCVAYIKGNGSEASQEHLGELYRRVRNLNARAALSRYTKITQLASALEAVVFEIAFKTSSATPSALNTIAQAVDCLGRLLHNGDTGATKAAPKAKLLVVDDDGVCNYMTVAALKRANFEVASAQDPKIALQLLQACRFDLVLLDINMPGMNGFEVCESLRRLPQYETVPVIFVTIQSDFQSRARSVVSGGDDFITKPISPMELALKVTMHLQKSQERRASARQAEADVPTGELPPASVRGTNDIPADGAGSAAPLDDIAATTEPPANLPGEAIQPGLATPATASPGVPSAGNEMESKPTTAVPSAKADVPTGELPPAPVRGTNDIPTDGAGSTAPLDDIAATKEPPANLPGEAIQPGLATPATASPDVPSAGNEMESAPTTALPSATELRTDDLSGDRLQPVSATETTKPHRDDTETAASTNPTQDAGEFPSTATSKPAGETASMAQSQPPKHGVVEFTWPLRATRPATEAPATGIATEGGPGRFKAPKTSEAVRGNTSPGNHKLHVLEKERNEHNQPFEQIVLEVARIMFGEDHLTDLNLRLVHIALEHYQIPEIMDCPNANMGGNGSEAEHKEPFEQTAFNVARILFGDDHLTDLNIRLVRIALEHYNVREIFKTTGGGEPTGQRVAFRADPCHKANLRASGPSRSGQRADNDGCTVMQEAGATI